MEALVIGVYMALGFGVLSVISWFAETFIWWRY